MFIPHDTANNTGKGRHVVRGVALRARRSVPAPWHVRHDVTELGVLREDAPREPDLASDNAVAVIWEECRGFKQKKMCVFGNLK